MINFIRTSTKGQILGLLYNNNRGVYSGLYGTGGDKNTKTDEFA
ncbi:MAG: hypothetical protein ABJA66_12330 [Actinomycetota bacterium]